MGSIIFDVLDDTFHYDFLLAAITTVLWGRCVILLRLTELFGPTLTMIYSMVIIIVQFLVLFVLGLITLASVATLTLSENPNFKNLYEAFRIYLMASLGSFDLYQYDVLDGWK